MTKQTLNEREFELINILGADLGANQRDLSRLMNLSLGMVNMLVRRLIAKGYIRIEQLNKRKVQYLLTPKGFAEKMQKSVKYTFKTINSISLIKNHVKVILQRLYKEGHKKFYVYSEPDLALIIERAFSEIKLDGGILMIIDCLPEKPLDGALLLGKEEVDTSQFDGKSYVDIIAEIAKDSVLDESEFSKRLETLK